MKIFSNHIVTVFLAIGLIMLFNDSFSQIGEEPRFEEEAGISVNISQLEGDGPDYIRQNASDFSTNFGTQASYQREWAAGLGAYFTESIKVFDFLRLNLNGQVGQYSSSERFEVVYDPALPSGLQRTESVVKNSYLNFTPGIAIEGRWKRLRLSVGANANVFITGKTTKSTEANLADGTSQPRAESGQLDTQDQPIFTDPSQVGGVADYTNVNLRNHGASPIWLSGVAKLSYKLFDKKWAPILGVSYQVPFTEIQRSQNPRWSLISAYSSDLHELGYGFKVSTLAFNLGWSF